MSGPNQAMETDAKETRGSSPRRYAANDRHELSSARFQVADEL
jgi:hypothetical protein